MSSQEKPRQAKKIIIVGAGAIGNYMGVQLRKSGHDIVFLGSPRVVAAVKHAGLTLQYPQQPLEWVAATELLFTADPAVCNGADLLLITAKGGNTAILAEQIQPHLAPHTILLTLQNGINNANVLGKAFPHHPVLAGMVTFNVVEINAHTFRLTTSGEIYLQKSSPSLLDVFIGSGLTVKEATNIQGMLWSKLLLNLINPLNALSGKSLKQNLEDHAFRLRWATCMQEGLAVLKAAGITPAKVTPLPPHWLPFMVSLPNWIYLVLAKNMTDMDPDAKSSMAQDIDKKQQTEIDYLTGELIQLGKKTGVPTPENERVYAQIKKLENNMGYA